MIIEPNTLSLVTTHQCTAACDHCCFHCSPKIKARIPKERLRNLLYEANEIPTIKVVVFTGGECFLLNEELDELVALATDLGFITRCVSNGYWAVNEKMARERLGRLVDAGLKEINFSTGPFHSKYVPTDRVCCAAVAAAGFGLSTLVICETNKNSGFRKEVLTEHAILKPLIQSKKVVFQESIWIDNGGKTKIECAPENSRFHPKNKSGCSTIMNTITVNPSLNLIACCGLHFERIPELVIGSVEKDSLTSVLTQAPDDLLKIWIHVKGPERILEFVKSIDPSYELPLDSTHPCETCLHLFKDQRARSIISEHYKEVEEEVVDRFLTQRVYTRINRFVKC